MKVAIQGEPGSFHHEAAMRLEPGADILPQRSFAGVFQAVLRGDAEYGLCATENNLHGSINEVYRLLERHNVWVVRDIRTHIAQQLIGPQAVSVGELAARDVSMAIITKLQRQGCSVKLQANIFQRNEATIKNEAREFPRALLTIPNL